MVFNDSTNKQGLCQYVDDLFSIGVSDYSLRSKARSANIWLEKAANIISLASAYWQWDDPNYTNQPYAGTDIVSGQRSYTLDTDYYAITAVALTDENGDKRRIHQIDKSEPTSRLLIENDSNNTGTPVRYDIYGDQIVLDPTPNYSSSYNSSTGQGGLEIHFERKPYYFLGDDSSEDNNREPGIPSMFHEYVALGMAYEYAMMRGLESERIKQRLNELEARMAQNQSKKNKDKRTVLSVQSYSKYRNLGL